MSVASIQRSAVRGSIVVIEPRRGFGLLDVAETWRYRELLYTLAWRDVKVRYKQTAMGVAWAVLQPLLAMAVFAVFFGNLAGIPSEGVPYPLFVLVGLVPWTYFANAIGSASHSLVDNANLVTKVYFPRLLIPASSVVSGLVDAGIASTLLIVAGPALGVRLSPTVVLAPVLVLWVLVLAFAFGVLLSALDVQYRDIRYATPFLIQVWMFATPIVYPATLLPERYRTWYGLNPMAGIVEGFRWALLGSTPPPGGMVALSLLVTILVLVVALAYFRQTERSFADVI